MDLYFLITLISLSACVSAQAVTEENCEVCVKLIRRFTEGLDSAIKSDSNEIEQAFKDYCKTATGKDERFCYYVGGLETSATYIVNEITKPIAWGMPAEKVCDKIKKLDAQVCSLKYEKQIDLVEADFKKMRVNELKKILTSWNQECKGCTEKSEFISLIEKMMPQYAPEAHHARAAKKTEL